MTTAALENEPSAARLSRGRHGSRPGLRDVLTAWFRYRRQAATAFVLPVLVALAAMLLDPPARQSQAVIIVTPAVAGAPIGNRVLFEAIAEVGSSRVYPDLPPGAAAAKVAATRLARDLVVQSGPDGRLVLTLSAGDPQVAVDLLKAIIMVAQRRSQPPPTRVEPEAGLAEVDAALAQLALSHEFSDYEAALRAIEVGRAAAAERLVELDQTLAAAQARASLLGRKGAETLAQEAALARAEAAGARRGRASVARAIAELDRRRADLVRLGPDYRSLTRTRSALELSLQARVARDAAAGLRAAPDVRLVQPASLLPEDGRRLQQLATGLLLGLAAAGLTVAALALGSDTMVTPRDAERRLGLRVVLAPPRRRPGEPILTYDDCKLLLQMTKLGEGSGRVLQLIAAQGGEGSTCLALDFARQAASAGARRVLLIDVEPPQGRSAAQRLADGGATINPVSPRVMRIGDTTLFVSAPVGGRDLAVAEHEWGQVIAEARRNFDLVLIDAPPLARSNTGLVIAPYADLLLVVVAAEETRAPVARNLLDRLSAAAGAPGGVIFNQRRFHIPERIYAKL